MVVPFAELDSTWERIDQGKSFWDQLWKYWYSRVIFMSKKETTYLQKGPVVVSVKLLFLQTFTYRVTTMFILI